MRLNIINVLLLVFESTNSIYLTENSGLPDLINLDWETIREDTIIRYFSPYLWYPADNAEEIWAMGQDVYCSVDPSTQVVTVDVPGGLDSALPVKAFTHGFSSEASDNKTQFVNAWMSTTGAAASVFLLDWSKLAKFGQADGWDNYLYDEAARNAIDVGNYFGACLAAMSEQYDIPGSEMHLAGHSLGAHLMGMAGRVFRLANNGGEQVGRVTGCDPAGPRFVDGMYNEAIPELHANMLSTDSASFVDAIHTDGSLEPCVVCLPTHIHFGLLQQVGHTDFYPSGGHSQHGCWTGQDLSPSCNHGRSYLYLLHSIWEPQLFPAKACDSIEACSNEEASGDAAGEYMGEAARNQGERVLRYVPVDDCHWDLFEHNSDKCYY